MNDLISLLSHNSAEPLLFHSAFFLVAFGLFLIVYGVICHRLRARDILLIVFSLYFYYKSSGFCVLLLTLSVFADYGLAIAIANSKRKLNRKLLLWLGILVSLAPLLYFKYSGFMAVNLNHLFGMHNKIDDLILPIGISFYTFQSISYIVDVYKKIIVPAKLRDFFLYMTFFPHLVAGPIVRARDFLPQLGKPTVLDKSRLAEAFWLITKGLIKKVIVADYIAQYSDSVFSTPNGFNGAEHLVALLAYTLQIFCDFSGYTDMAIGIALLLGYRLCVNFDSPYKSLNISVFWRRWHISLSSWLRDYIYIPLGGNRRGLRMQMLFLIVTMLIGGIWHGASWKFVLWGASHGLLLAGHKLATIYIPQINTTKRYQIASWGITFVCVALLWVPFRATSWEDTMIIYGKLFGGFDITYFAAMFKTNPLLFILLGFGYSATLIPEKIKKIVRSRYLQQDFIVKIVLLVIVIQIYMQIKSSVVQPFIYFQF